MDLNRNVMKTNKVVASTCRSRCWPVLAATEFEALNVSDLLKCDIALRRRRTLAMPTSNVTKVWPRKNAERDSEQGSPAIRYAIRNIRSQHKKELSSLAC